MPASPPRRVIADDLYSFENLWRQYRACRRNKRNTFNALAFEVDAEASLLALQAELRAHTYRPGRSICFVSRGAKPREVFAADFRDRVVHHVLVSRQEPLFERRFSYESFACRKGKGTLAASDRLMAHLRSATANGQRSAHALKLDVASFFPSIDKRILYEQISRAMRDPELLWLTRVILFHDPTENYRFRSLVGHTPGPGAPGYPVPERKSLFGKDGLRGLPIGNLTSQFWANVYLDALDQFVKRVLRCRWYVRYVDDLVLLSRDADQLLEWRRQIAEFLRVQLALELRPGVRELLPVARGVEFVGWKTWWNHRLPRRQTTGNLIRAVARFERLHVRPACAGGTQRLDLATPARPKRGVVSRPLGGRRSVTAVAALREVLASYAGHLSHGSSWREWERVWRDSAWLRALFARDGWSLRPRWPSAGAELSSGGAVRYGERYRAVTALAGDACLVFWPVGRFIEFYGPQRLLAERVLGLRRARIARGDYAFAAGFPRALFSRYLSLALAIGLAVAVTARKSVFPSRKATRTYLNIERRWQT